MSSDGRPEKSARRTQVSLSDQLLVDGVVLGAGLLVPWLYATFEQVRLRRLRFEGFRPYRTLWLVPLWYGSAAAVTALLFPDRLAAVPAVHLLAVTDLAGLTDLGTVAPVVVDGGITTPDRPPWRLLAAGGVVLSTLPVGWRCHRWSERRRYERAGTDGFVLPLRNVVDTGGTAVRSRLQSLDRDRSILVLGETGAGKSEAIKLLGHQLRREREDALVVFDYKTELRPFFASRVSTDGHGDEATDDGPPHAAPAGARPAEDDIVVLSLSGSTRYWNLFREVDDESEFAEVGRALFPREEGADEFFEPVARQVFVAVLTYLYREGKRAGQRPTNRDVVAFLGRDREEIVAELTRDRHADLSVERYLDPDAPKQSLGVLATVERTVSEVFVDDFARGRDALTDGGFGVREYLRNPDGRTLVLDFPISRGESVGPAFSFLLDWAIRFGLEDDRHQATFVLDEFQRVPPLERIEDLLNTGRSLNARAILGLQSVSQLETTYGEAAAEAMLSGLAQQVLLRVGDAESVAYVRDQLGAEFRAMASTTYDRKGNPDTVRTTRREVAPVAERELRQLDTGSGFVLTPGSWVRGSLHLLSEVRDRLDAATDGRR